MGLIRKKMVLSLEQLQSKESSLLTIQFSCTSNHYTIDLGQEIMSPSMTCQHSTHERWTKCKQKCGKTNNVRQGEGLDNLIATLMKRLFQMVSKHNRTNHVLFHFYIFFVFCFKFCF